MTTMVKTAGNKPAFNVWALLLGVFMIIVTPLFATNNAITINDNSATTTATAPAIIGDSTTTFNTVVMKTNSARLLGGVGMSSSDWSSNISSVGINTLTTGTNGHNATINGLTITSSTLNTNAFNITDYGVGTSGNLINNGTSMADINTVRTTGGSKSSMVNRVGTFAGNNRNTFIGSKVPNTLVTHRLALIHVGW